MSKNKKYIHRNEPVPQDGRRACLCRDGHTYSRKCCGGDYFNQGIGNITGDAS